MRSFPDLYEAATKRLTIPKYHQHFAKIWHIACSRKSTTVELGTRSGIMENWSFTILCPAGPVVLVSSAPLERCLDLLANAAIAPTEHNRDQEQICKKIKVPKGEEIQMGRDMRRERKGSGRTETTPYITSVK